MREAVARRSQPEKVPRRKASAGLPTQKEVEKFLFGLSVRAITDVLGEIRLFFWIFSMHFLQSRRNQQQVVNAAEATIAGSHCKLKVLIAECVPERVSLVVSCGSGRLSTV